MNMTRINHEGPVTLTGHSQTEQVEGYCTEPDCAYELHAFGEQAARTMARRHLVLVHGRTTCSRCGMGQAPVGELLCGPCRDNPVGEL